MVNKKVKKKIAMTINVKGRKWKQKFTGKENKEIKKFEERINDLMEKGWKLLTMKFEMVIEK